MQYCLSCGANLATTFFSEVYACQACVENSQIGSTASEVSLFEHQQLKSTPKRGVRFEAEKESWSAQCHSGLSMQQYNNPLKMKTSVASHSATQDYQQRIRLSECENQKATCMSSSARRSAFASQFYDEDQSMPHKPAQDSTADTFAPVRKSATYRIAVVLPVSASPEITKLQ